MINGTRYRVELKVREPPLCPGPVCPFHPILLEQVVVPHRGFAKTLPTHVAITIVVGQLKVQAGRAPDGRPPSRPPIPPPACPSLPERARAV